MSLETLITKIVYQFQTHIISRTLKLNTVFIENKTKYETMMIYLYEILNTKT